MWSTFQSSVVAGCLLVAPPPFAFAQAFNIDVAGDLSMPPGDAYGAAAGQAGYWNAVRHSDGLVRIDGQSTTVTYSGGSGFELFDIPGASGDDELLMESAVSVISSDVAARVLNLTPGLYDLYVYSWGGSLFGPRTVGMRVYNGQSEAFGSVFFTSTWPGGQVEGVTYDRIRFDVLPGQNGFLLYIGSQNDFDVLNGLQLVPVPAPSALFVAPLSGLMACRRRR